MAVITQLLPGMSADALSKPLRCSNVAGSSKLRLMGLDDLDQRTKAYRRAQEIRSAIISDLTGGGTSDDLSAIKLALVDSVVVMSVVCEDIQSRYLAGDPKADLKQLTVLTNARRRDAQLCGLDRVARDVTGNLELYLAKGAR
ncbi:hypothetical protein QBK99_13280 [Corticibacterium sp. UT-5YL-CI-8]|nr:hypothetical protein [Tianweitania sp. UT-5YL-CI-8]